MALLEWQTNTLMFSNGWCLIVFCLSLLVNSIMQFESQLLLFISYSSFITIIYIITINYFYFSHHLWNLYGPPTTVPNEAIASKIQNHIMRNIIFPYFFLPTVLFTFRLLTYKLRMPAPDIHIIGEMKCGTTTMSECLKSLGMIGPFSMLNHRLCHGKESLFFVGFQGSYLMKKKYYSMCFPFRFTAKPLVFDACPHNLFLTHAHRRMVNNKNKYIIMVRNPIKKIESNYTHSYLEAKQFIKFGSLKKSLHRYSSYEQAIKTNLNNEALIHNTLQVLSDIGVDDEVPYLDA
eukprot:872909_1